ncbi:MAG: serine hydrolase domain-containing protein [Vicinamibacterales bacterium]
MKPIGHVVGWSRVAALMAAVSVTPALLAQSLPAAPYGTVAAGAYAEEIREARERIERYIDARGVPGLSVAVAVGGITIWSEGFGFANVEHRAPVTPVTRFRSGSVAKPITMAAAARLHEMGRLDLDAPVQKYVPGFPAKGATITPRMLAGHLSGIRHYPPDGNEFFNTKVYADVEETLEIFQNDPLLFPPGTKYSYSSYGTNLLGLVVQKAAGKPFLQVVQELVFDPLGMTSSSGDFPDRIIPWRVSYYERTGGKPSYHTRKSSWGTGEKGVLLNAPYSDNSNKYPSGGFITNPSDLVRFGSAHLAPGFLKAETLTLLFTSQRTSSGQVTGYGMNWQIRTAAPGPPFYAHSGSSVGGTSFLMLYPDSKVVLAIQANLTDAEFRDLPREVAQVFARRATVRSPASRY